jgi:hypothetical protein
VAEEGQADAPVDPSALLRPEGVEAPGHDHGVAREQGVTVAL